MCLWFCALFNQPGWYRQNGCHCGIRTSLHNFTECVSTTEREKKRIFKPLNVSKTKIITATLIFVSFLSLFLLLTLPISISLAWHFHKSKKSERCNENKPQQTN